MMHMNFFKRATTSIIRRPGKTIILLLLVFILGSVIAGAIAVEGAISNTDANLRRNMQPILSVQHDWEEWNRHVLEEYGIDLENFDWNAFDPDDPSTHPPEAPPLRPSDIRAIGASDYINFYDFITNSQLRSFDLERYGDNWREPGMPQFFDFRGSSSRNLIHIDQGTIELVQGNQFSENDLIPSGERSVAIVSEGFANVNNLSLGSVFVVYEHIMFPEIDEDGEMWGWGCWGAHCYEDENIYTRIDMEFEIIGLFDAPLDDGVDSNSQEYWDRMRALNFIYVPNWSLEDVSTRIFDAQRTMWESLDVDTPEWFMRDPDADDDEFQMWVVPVFVLEDPADMDAFREEAGEFLPPGQVFVDLSSAFDDIASSMETMQTIANWILYVSIGATLLILSLLITLFLRDRRHEMGVYLALGEKKGKIISQILIEVIVTSFVAITLSVFVGTLISSAVSRNMLMNELTAEQNNDPWGGGHWEWNVFDDIGIPTNDMSVDEMMAAFDISLSPQTIGLFYVIGLGAVILSTLAPVIYIVTLNPKKVLL